MIEQRVSLERMEYAAGLFGSFDENIRLIERELSVQITIREEELKVSGEGEQVLLAVKTLEGLLNLLQRGEPLNEQTIRYVISLARSGQEDKVNELAKDVICVTASGKPIKAKTAGQSAYVKAVQKHTITLEVGQDGTGKTYMAVEAAVAAFKTLSYKH
ncbi:MAG: PhoH family protein, partial [Clostridiales bacterium]|nr:PhoH family protein [Clostridiales bacterium]